MMHYETTYRTDPTAEQAWKLRNYVAGNATLVVDETGTEAHEDQLAAFAKGAECSKETRQHTVSMAEEHSVDELAEAGRKVADESLDGNFMIGIHNPDDGNAHIHVAEFAQERRGHDFDIPQFRESLEKHIDDPPAW
jgi:hypothetical protein